MAKWIVEVNEGYGWEEPMWTPSFRTEEEAWDFVYGEDPTDTGRWDGGVRVVQEDDEEDF